MAEWVPQEEIDKAVAGQTVPTEFVKTVQGQADQVALRWKDGDAWQELTWRQVGEQVAQAAAGLRALGLGPGDRMVIMMRNRPEFHVVDLAALMLGATAVSIYNSSSPEQVQYLASHCRAKVAIVEDTDFLERFLKVRTELPDLADIVILSDPDGLAGDEVHQWPTLFEAGSVDLTDECTNAKPEDLATVIYTSGTTGPPKGVMISHYNVVFTAESLRLALELSADELAGKRVISYLPMAHIAERMTSHYQWAIRGPEVTTCPEPTLIAQYAGEVRPHLMFGVPRVWEKVYAGVNGALAADPEKGQKFNEAVAAAKPIRLAALERDLTKEEQETLDFLDAVAFNPVKELVGLDQVEFAITGAAPIPVEVLEWFITIGVPMSEIYGLSETTGPMTYDAVRIRPGTVGRAIPGCEVKLADDGEVVCRGGNVFQGYLDDPERTAEVLDDDGWFHSGDIGEMDDDGYLRIVDRKKELIITAGGKNISPANLEAALKTIPLVGQACAIGDNRPFVSALLVLDPEVAPAWAKSQGIEFDSLEDLAKNEAVIAEVQKGVDEANRGFARAEQIKKFTLLGEEWLPDTDLLTPTSKLKRRGVHERYAAEIEALYAS